MQKWCCCYYDGELMCHLFEALVFLDLFHVEQLHAYIKLIVRDQNANQEL